ncbi:fibrinogen-like YCDxxxxGGGW domain-containing protein [Jatrophihabitans lederbergiae]|uniref:Fibrinogen-like YCDxxxxGGGW domain-containing protein n=1 Tax=Jatrophihabitans lederbergiae TaxID=3075547 RepID=A0ABU2JA34_9ACTN|nr:fibrinogen-like YCDxxxxGGGW domain-containing protein [Jatrophihabitans sp. DSM 44399]MDT0261852.1 fibrinogen-like YCDxxxxGGGW domain-containing protein [Jatrophihabitans sp. DSM 44399]
MSSRNMQGPAAGRNHAGLAALIRRSRTLATTVAVTAGVLAGGLVGVGTAAPATAGTPVVLDGSQSSLAAPSCWAIKQQKPTSTDGVYWLQTAQLIAPEQFYCDMTTDGGGWVLAGRGRENWTWAYGGQGSTAALRNTPTGTGVFAPATLSAATVEGLLGGGRVDALTDGIRVRRATNVAGTAYQELRLKPANRANWTWAIGGGVLTSAVSVDGLNYSGGNTQSWATASTEKGLFRLYTTESKMHNYKMGFGYGDGANNGGTPPINNSTVVGQNNATSYLWQYGVENGALPFSQVWLRPKLTTSSYQPIPAAGLPASTVRPLASSTTSPNTPWGVTGIVGTPSELNMEVETFAQIGNVMYVGGGFQYVQKGANPAAADKIAQPWLAAFDVNTGAWISSFRPALNNRVWDLQATPDGKLVVGGEFTTVNGATGSTGITELDPITGAKVSTWNASVEYINTEVGNPGPQVKAIDYQDGWLYIGGRFNRVTGGTPVRGPVTVGRAARLRVSDGQPDGTWKPNFDGSVIELDASAKGDRVYFSGYFNNVNGVASKNIGVISTAAGAASVPGLAAWQPSIGSGVKTYQQAIKEDGNYVWQGGSEHVLGQYDRSSYALKSSDITKAGGDIQTIAIYNGVVYASCHCGNYAYSNDLHYDNPIPYASDVNNIKYIGAWDEVTGQYLPDFYPGALDTRSGIGGWELTPDSNGCLWFGGDFKQGSYQSTGYQWLGGFGKFCPRDSVAPTTPANLTVATASTGGTRLSWNAATDNSGAVHYEVLRGDRVIGATTGLSYIDTTGSLPANYWVRAVDNGGNRSATTAMVTMQAPDTTAPTASITSPASGASVYGPVTVTATAADDRAVSSVDLLVDGAVLATSTTAPYSFNWSATAVGSHTLQVVAHDAAGNTGASTSVTVTVPPDTTAPSAPGALSSTGVTTTAATLSWSAATDDRAVAGYQVLRNATVVGQTTALSYTDTGLTAGTTYTYTVRAVDAAGNVGPDSNAVAVTTSSQVAPLFAESWPGTDGAAWSPAWTSSAASGTVDTRSGAGRIAVDDVSGAYARTQLTGLAVRSDSELLTSFSWSSNTALSYLTIYLRGSGGWQNAYRPKNGYGLQLQSNSGTVVVQKNVNSVTSTVQSVTGGQALTTAKQWLRLRVSGSTVQFKIWTDGSTEPTTWKSTNTDTSVATAGQLFLSVVRGGTNVGAKSVAFDDLSIGNAE